MYVPFLAIAANLSSGLCIFLLEASAPPVAGLTGIGILLVAAPGWLLPFTVPIGRLSKTKSGANH